MNILLLDMRQHADLSSTPLSSSQTNILSIHATRTNPGLNEECGQPCQHQRLSRPLFYKHEMTFILPRASPPLLPEAIIDLPSDRQPELDLLMTY